MSTQNTVYQTLFNCLGTVKNILADSPACKITPIAKRICNVLKIVDERGTEKINSCIGALRKLAKKVEGVVLPETTRTRREVAPPKVLPENLPMPENLPAQAENIPDLSVELVQSDEDKILWNKSFPRT